MHARKSFFARRFRRQCDVAEFYGFWPGVLPLEAVLALEASIPRLEARRYRRGLRLAPDVSLSVDQVYELIKVETGSEDQAQEAATRYAAGIERAKSEAST